MGSFVKCELARAPFDSPPTVGTKRNQVQNTVERLIYGQYQICVATFLLFIKKKNFFFEDFHVKRTLRELSVVATERILPADTENVTRLNKVPPHASQIWLKVCYHFAVFGLFRVLQFRKSVIPSTLTSGSPQIEEIGCQTIENPVRLFF